jgi:hypothetical protein
MFGIGNFKEVSTETSVKQEASAKSNNFQRRIINEGRIINEDRCDERLTLVKVEESTCLTYTCEVGDPTQKDNEFECHPSLSDTVRAYFDIILFISKHDTTTRLDNRLGQGNRRTDVQRIRGQATDEQMSTDLDCTKSRLLCVQPVSLF